MNKKEKMKKKSNSQEVRLEVLFIRRTRKEKVLLVIKNGVDVSAFQKALDQADGVRATVEGLMSKISLEIRELDQT